MPTPSVQLYATASPASPQGQAGSTTREKEKVNPLIAANIYIPQVLILLPSWTPTCMHAAHNFRSNILIDSCIAHTISTIYSATQCDIIIQCHSPIILSAKYYAIVLLYSTCFMCDLTNCKLYRSPHPLPCTRTHNP